MASFSRGFIDDAHVYDDHYPSLADAHRLRGQAERSTATASSSPSSPSSTGSRRNCADSGLQRVWAVENAIYEELLHDHGENASFRWPASFYALDKHYIMRGADHRAVSGAVVAYMGELQRLGLVTIHRDRNRRILRFVHHHQRTVRRTVPSQSEVPAHAAPAPRPLAAKCIRETQVDFSRASAQPCGRHTGRSGTCPAMAGPGRKNTRCQLASYPASRPTDAAEGPFLQVSLSGLISLRSTPQIPHCRAQ